MPDPIEHVVVLMLENNSFDRMLGCMTAVYPQIDGVKQEGQAKNPDYPDATQSFAQLSIATDAVAVDPAHDLDDVIRQTDNGACDGFVRDFVQHNPQAPQDERAQIMAYFKLGGLPVLHELASNYLVCDRWFSSVPGPTWPNRFFVHSGTSLGHVDMPEGFFSPAIHLYNQPTVFERLSERNISWRIYYGDVPQSLAMTVQLQYPGNYRKMASFAADAASPADSFPKYVFIEPTYFGAGQNDEHPPTDVMHGEALLASVYNALRGNPALWASTLFVVLYDEHGGFYDHVPPPATVAPDGNTKTFAFNSLGVRVPAILISAWLDKGVLPTEFDHTSLLRYVSDKWGLGPLGNRTAAANSFASAFVRASMRTDCPAALAVPTGAPSDPNPPLTANQVALASLTHRLEVSHTRPGSQTVAAHSEAMAADYASRSQTVAEQTDQFLADAQATRQQ
jgi:phospholipase C